MTGEHERGLHVVVGADDVFGHASSEFGCLTVVGVGLSTPPRVPCACGGLSDGSIPRSLTPCTP